MLRGAFKAVVDANLWCAAGPASIMRRAGWTKFLEDKYSSMKAAERDALVERMSIIQENPWVKDEM
jgi:hypothetical protein